MKALVDHDEEFNSKITTIVDNDDDEDDDILDIFCLLFQVRAPPLPVILLGMGSNLGRLITMDYHGLS